MMKLLPAFAFRSAHAFSAAIFAAAAVVAVPVTAVRAADPAYCAHYASQAVWQYNRNRSIPGCFHGTDGTWHADYQRHYGWCVTADLAAARDADSYRGDKLHECSMRAYGHP